MSPHSRTPVPLWLPWSVFGLGCVAMAHSALFLLDREGPRSLSLLLGVGFAVMAYKVFQIAEGVFKARR